MTLYYELSAMERGMFGIFATVLIIAALVILVSVCALHMGRRLLFFATVLTAENMFLLQGLEDVNYQLQKRHSLSYFAGAIGNLPYGVVILCMCLIAIAEVVFFCALWHKKKNMLTPGAIKESLDALPDGVCFFDADGQPLLVNIQMNRLSGEFFHKEILNVWSFLMQLKGRMIKDSGEIIHTYPTLLACTDDGKIWEFCRNTLIIGRSPIYELVAYDITRQYQLSQELEKRNQKLGEINERLRLYSQEVERITAEQEILNAKMQIHDNVGRSLLAFRAYLSQTEKERNKESLLFLWKSTIALLRNEAVPAVHSSDWDLLLKAAKAVDVAIVRNGELPTDGKVRQLLIGAVHECLTNTVKHANGNQLFLSIRSSDTMIVSELTNNGIPPSDEIQENGGLRNLRCTVEAAGGRMTVESSPRFVLRLELLKGEERKWQR